VLLYWQIGQDILARQQAQGWGAKAIARLARDLTAAFPGMKGFSPRNLKYMRAFAEAWPDAAIEQEVLAELPWYHQLALLDKLKTREDREWYAARALEHGWSRNILAVQIESHLHQRQGAAQSNFDRRLPPHQSGLARRWLCRTVVSLWSVRLPEVPAGRVAKLDMLPLAIALGWPTSRLRSLGFLRQRQPTHAYDLVGWR
jgi:predicted nuclease of restriction endonuclease-like (RecB) superfamily